MIIDKTMKAALGSDVNWVSMKQALIWGVGRYETEDAACGKLEELITNGILLPRYHVSAQGRYLGGGLCQQVPVLSNTKFGTRYAYNVVRGEGLGEPVSDEFISKLMEGPPGKSVFLWDHNVIGVINPGTDQAHGQYWAHYGVDLAVHQLEEQGIAPRTATAIRISERGRPLSKVMPYWIAELVNYLELNVPELKSTDAIIDDVNCIIKNRRSNERGLPDDYGELPDPTLTPWVSTIRQRLMERISRG